MRRAPRIIFSMIVIYMALPIVIFLIGWTRPIISIPSSIVVGIVSWRIIKDKSVCPRLPFYGKKEREIFILAVVIVALWVYFSGIGGFSFQFDDHRYRSGLFNMLVNNDWPVVQSYVENGKESTYLLVYYIAFWMPSAIIGKVFGLGAGYIFQVFWAIVGIWFFYYLVSCYLKKASLLPLIVFIFFSGLSAVGTGILKGFEQGLLMPQEPWALGLQFSSFTTQLFWVFNQAIPGWLLTIIILMQSKNRYVIFFMGISLLACPFPFVGTIPFLIYTILKNAWKTKNLKKAASDLFSPENIFGGGITGLITYLYFKTNKSSKHVLFQPAESQDPKFFIFLVVVFVLLEVGVFFVIVYKYQKKNPLLYIALSFLCVCPMFKVGYGGDFCMRACIPAQVVLFLLVMQTLYKARKCNDKALTLAITVVLLIGSIMPIQVFNITIGTTINRYANHEQILAEPQSDEQLMTGENCNNFRGNANKSFFYKYIAR